MEEGSRRHTYLRPLGGAALAVRAMMGSEHEEPIVRNGFREPLELSACPRDGRTVGSIVRLVSVFAGRSVKVSSSFLEIPGGLFGLHRRRPGQVSVISGSPRPDGPGDADHLVRDRDGGSVASLPSFDLQIDAAGQGSCADEWPGGRTGRRG